MTALLTVSSDCALAVLFRPGVPQFLSALFGWWYCFGNHPRFYLSCPGMRQLLFFCYFRRQDITPTRRSSTPIYLSSMSLIVKITMDGVFCYLDYPIYVIIDAFMGVTGLLNLLSTIVKWTGNSASFFCCWSGAFGCHAGPFVPILLGFVSI